MGDELPHRLKPLFEVAPLIAEGRLVEVLPEAPPLPVTLGILLPPRTKASSTSRF